MAGIHIAMINVASKIGSIGKDSQNEQQKFNFRSIDTVYNELHSILVEEKIYSLPNVIRVTREEKTIKEKIVTHTVLEVEYTFQHVDGSCVKTVVVGEGMDYGDKSASKAMSIAHKYAMLQVFSIPTEDSDDFKKDPDSESFDAREAKKEKKAQPKFIAPSGKYQGKDIRTVPLAELKAYYEELKAAVNGKKLDHKAENFILAIETTLAESFNDYQKTTIEKGE